MGCAEHERWRDQRAVQEVEHRYDSYDVVDVDGDKIGTVDHTYASEAGQPE